MSDLPKTIAVGERCQKYCGGKHCNYTWLSGIGSFNQGTGFTPEQAEALVTRYNAWNDAGALYARLRDLLQQNEPKPRHRYVVVDMPTALGFVSMRYMPRVKLYTNDKDSADECAYLEDADEPAPDKALFFKHVVVDRGDGKL